MKKIGILGGMGPEATSDLYLKIIQYYQLHYGAKYDNDFPAIVIYSVPIPDVVESVENEQTTKEMLTEAAKVLEGAGCEFIIIACNTVQFLLEELRQEISIEIKGIAEVNAEILQRKKQSKVGILSTQATIEKGVYADELSKRSIELVCPDQQNQEVVTKAIMAQLAGNAGTKEKHMLLQVIDSLVSAGAEAILLACTDIPLMLTQADTEIPLIDCSKNYADYAAKFSKE